MKLMEIVRGVIVGDYGYLLMLKDEQLGLLYQQMIRSLAKMEQPELAECPENLRPALETFLAGMDLAAGDRPSARAAFGPFAYLRYPWLMALQPEACGRLARGVVTRILGKEAEAAGDAPCDIAIADQANRVGEMLKTDVPDWLLEIHTASQHAVEAVFSAWQLDEALISRLVSILSGARTIEFISGTLANPVGLLNDLDLAAALLAAQAILDEEATAEELNADYFRTEAAAMFPHLAADSETEDDGDETDWTDEEDPDEEEDENFENDYEEDPDSWYGR